MQWKKSERAQYAAIGSTRARAKSEIKGRSCGTGVRV